MLTRFIARSLMSIVPEKYPALLTLTPDSAAPTTVQVYNAWLKPIRVSKSMYDNSNLQGNETLIQIPQHELNPNNNGYQIRPRDRITINGVTYIVQMATLKTVLTVWECVAQKEMN